MPSLADILADPVWLPFAFDIEGDRVQFVRLTRDQHRGEVFLADFKPASDGATFWASGAELRAARIDPQPIHFIFHTSFCRSTLLAKALDLPGIAMGYCEPGIMNFLAVACARSGDWGRAMIGPIVDLLARPMAPGETVIVKPSNIANRVLPLVLEQRPGARAVLMTGSLDAYLHSIAKKGLQGRIWVRRLYKHIAEYAPLDLGFGADELFLLSDMQVTALAWLLHQRHFAALLASPLGGRMATLYADEFNDNRAQSFAALGRFLDLAIDDARAGEIAGGKIFDRHIKLGTDFAETVAREEKTGASPAVEAEIDMVAQWIDTIIAGLDVKLPVSQPLLAR